VIQGSPEWFAARLGKATASHMSDIMARTKSGYGAGRKNYMTQLLCERLTGEREETYTNVAMQHGIDTEPMAISEYELETGLLVTPVGFIDHPTIPMCGASPDGLVGDEGLIEVKCPNTATHIATLMGGPVKRDYILQMHWQMSCTGRVWCDFVSYDNRLPAKHAMIVQRVERDDTLAKTIEIEVELFLKELDALVIELNGI